MAVSTPMASPYFKVTCETEGVNYKYSTDGSEPSLVSEDLNSSGRFQIVKGSPMTIRIRAYKDGMEPSDIATCTYTPVTVPMALPDGSVLFYDRGSTYGEYHIDDTGYPVRNDGAGDEGTAESSNWRYLICDKSNLAGTTWGPLGTSEGVTDTEIGSGFSNTYQMIMKYANNDKYLWRDIAQRIAKDDSRWMWFLPSSQELYLLYQNKDTISRLGADALSISTSFWSSSEFSDVNAWSVNFMNGTQNDKSKTSPCKCRVIRRI